MLTTSLFLPGLTAALAVIAYGAIRLPLTEPRHATPTPPRRPRPAEDSPRYTSPWPCGWPHDAPDQPLTLLQAHQAMQSHRECSIKECARKAAAFDALIGAGAIKPRTR